MKKIFIVFGSVLLLASCGSKGKSGKQIAEEVCDCSKKANALPTTDSTRGLQQNDCLKQQRAAWEKIKDDQEKADEFNKALAKCAEEQIKKSFGQ